MNVELSAKAARYLAKMDGPAKERIKEALRKLSLEPPEGDIKSLVGRDGYRARVGQYRILFDKTEDKITVYEIGSRGQIYKGGR